MRRSWWPPWEWPWLYGRWRNYLLSVLTADVIVAAYFFFTGHGDWAFVVVAPVIVFIIVTTPTGGQAP